MRNHLLKKFGQLFAEWCRVHPEKTKEELNNYVDFIEWVARTDNLPI